MNPHERYRTCLVCSAGRRIPSGPKTSSQLENQEGISRSILHDPPRKTKSLFFVLFSFSLFFFFVFLVKKKCVVGQIDNEGSHEIHTKKKHQQGDLITETNGDS
ncbi:hypothetical protein F4774DRAFT_227400 [Daldinia eschscholtzii]|nr:hypothetical protein F4774DRAFT_227400 [Daldinia eschscholtzii]